MTHLPITPEVVLKAYSVGLFPMADSGEDEAIYWVDPDKRGVFPLDRLIVSRSLAKTVRGDRYEIVADRDFDAVIDGCARRGGDSGPERTWINPEIRRLYRALFERGHVHTIEARAGGELVGGLYGVALRGAFFGESMFHRARDASKVALVHLVARLRLAGYRLLDAQFVTEHLASLGAVEIARAEYRARLTQALAVRPVRDAFAPDLLRDGAAALAALGTGVNYP